MKKQGKKNTTAPTTPKVEQPAGAAGKTVQAAKVLYLQVKEGGKFRGARAAWYERLQKHNGKPAAEFLASAKEKPPSLPKNGVAEAPQGWLSYFVRTGTCALVERA